VTVLVDTSVWSLALRRTGRSDSAERRELEDLVGEGRAGIIGPIRQEILSGVRNHDQFIGLRDRLRAFPDIEILTQDYEEAVVYFNRCRARGVQGSNTDFLICAVSVRREMPVFTVDGDFPRYARLLPIALHIHRFAGGSA
jgi:predicted nucleic acid-binding protein